MRRRDCLAGLAALPLAWVGPAPTAQAKDALKLLTINNFTSRVNANVLKKVYGRIGQDMTVVSMPPSRVTALTTQGLVDGEVNRIRSYGDAHPSLIRIEPPISEWTVSALYRASANLAIRTGADLATHALGIVRGLKATADMTATFSRVSIAPSSRELMLMLDGNRFEVAVDGTDESAFYIRKLGLKGITVVELSRFPLYHYLHEKNRQLVPLIARELKKLADSGELKRIFDEASIELVNSGEEP
jgi:polar amino acid transport system substrate-binding protein